MSRAFRFGVVAAFARSAEEWQATARRIETLGYSTIGVPDGMRHSLAPLQALAVAGACTSSLRLCPYVLANDFRNPVLLAKDIASLDLLTGGRVEVGIGAGRPNAEEDNRLLGIPFESGGVRVRHLADALSALKHQLGPAGEVSPKPVQQPRPPILVAGAGKQLLSLAAREADIVALGLPPTATEDVLTEKLGWLRAAAGGRFSEIELNLNLMAVGDQVPRYLSAQMGLDAQKLAGAMSAVVGDVDAMCSTLERRREQFGVSYIMVSDELMEALAPVVERVAGR
jgi:probable F420-dependent oxidoreductase